MIDVGIVHGCKEMAVPVWMGYDLVYVHTDIHQDLTPDPVTGEVNPDMYIYHEYQYSYREYLQMSENQHIQDKADIENVICDNDAIYSQEMANLENAMCEEDYEKENV